MDLESKEVHRMNILLATDGSECADVATRFLTHFNLTTEDRIIIFHVVSEIPYEDEYHAQIKRVIRRVAPKILSSASDILKDVKAKVSVELRKRVILTPQSWSLLLLQTPTL